MPRVWRPDHDRRPCERPTTVGVTGWAQRLMADDRPSRSVEHAAEGGDRVASPEHGRLAVAVGVIGVIVLAVAAITVLTRGQTAVTVDDAVSAFRADRTASPSPAPSSEPPPTPGTETAATEDPGSPQPAVGDEEAARTSDPQGDAEREGSSVEPERPEPRPAASEPSEEATERHLTVPEEGVYTYATDGGESVDTLGGARHDYPDETTITVRHTGCGYTARWEPLRERWEEFDICRDHDRAWMRTITVYHEFFGHGMRHDYACGEAATIAEASSETGQDWTWECHSDHGSMTTVVEIVGFAIRNVGGQPVEAVHVRQRSTMDGDVRGTREADVWYDRWSGLELEGTYETDSTVDTPMGPSRYTERVSRTLTDLDPRH